MSDSSNADTVFRKSDNTRNEGKASEGLRCMILPPLASVSNNLGSSVLHPYHSPLFDLTTAS
jgi:hypothetical protein